MLSYSWRSGLLVGLIFALSGCGRGEWPVVARAADYLWSQQANDGGWHSKTYGLLRSGQSLTAFVLEALLQVPRESYPLPEAKVGRAIAFLSRHTRADGAVGMANAGVPDYPNYATALTLSAVCRARMPEWEEHARLMVLYLRGQQFTEQNGWQEKDPAYGAWGMGGDRRTPPDTGHVDLSMSRYVLDALRAAGTPQGDPIFKRARVFVERCQNFDPQHPNDADGGFFFSTTEHDTNKAGHDGKRFRSYGTTTADGILALLATGASRNDPRVLAAERWLTTRHKDMEVPGFSGEAYQRWPRGLGFYYAGASAQAFRALAFDGGSGVAEALRRTQRADGSWANSENLVKEDDPLIATPLAIRALILSR
jgi:hypothetical protein